METRAGYVTVGAFAILLFAGGLFLAIWFGGVRLDQETRPFRINFEGSVTGLSTGSSVRYRGVPVGTVTDISIDPKDVERIRVTIEIDAGVPVKRNMYAVLEAQGLTGIGFIQIQGGTAAAEDLVATGENPVPVIPSRASALSKVFQTAPEIADELVLLIARLRSFLSEENEEALHSILANLATVTASIAGRSDDIDTILAEGATTIRDVRTATAEIVLLVSNLNTELEELVDEVGVTLSALRGTAVGIDGEVLRLSDSISRTSDRIGGTAAQLEALVAESRPGVHDFTNTGLYELTQALVELRVMVSSVDRVLRQIDRDPSQYLFGNRDGRVEAE